MLEATGLPWEVTTTMDQDNAYVGVAAKDTGRDQPLHRDRRLELVADDILKVEGFEPAVMFVEGRMEKHRRLETFSRGPERLVGVLVETPAGNAGAHLDADRAGTRRPPRAP